MNKQFARIIESSDGRQTLFYVEPEGGDYTLHQVANFEGYQADFKIGFDSRDEDENERKAYVALDAVDQSSADQLIKAVSSLIGGAA